MDISAELIGNHILVKKPRDIGRVYTKSHIGTPLSGNIVQLNLLEGVFLVDEGKMRVFEQKKEVGMQHLVLRAAAQLPEFETQYLVYKDLRTRGHAISLDTTEPPGVFRKHQSDRATPSCVIVPFSERDTLDIDATHQLIHQSRKKKDVVWYALVDEEGDLTYYDVSLVDLRGDVAAHQYPKGKCVMLKNRGIVFDTNLAGHLLQKEFFGKPFGAGLQLSFVEALYLQRKKVLDILRIDGTRLSYEASLVAMRKFQPDIEKRLLVFQELKQRGLLVKTGFKFGAHFRAYTKQPDATHAEYLIHVVDKGFTSIWAEISRAVRLAHSVNKEFVFARIDGTSVDYLKLGRLRP
ncbi:MAG: tRNA-intron lyase [Candidatus Thermoplasmatota archaeon]|nr:tRNA-intron lyase [Candidatus Thermoplasmatota archaeon]